MNTTTTYDYREILAASEKVRWTVDDLMGGHALDFSRPFLPESLARVDPLDFLTPAEKRTLNQVRGNSYLCIFGLVEEFILPFVLDHVRTQLSGEDERVRAMLQFAGEEAKHIHLFKRFREEFTKGFGTECAVIGPPEAIAKAVLAHEPLAVALAILQIEWMTQRHYLDAVRDDAGIDPMFRDLLKHHWMEEAQHAKLDALMVEALAEGKDAEALSRAVDGYLAIGGFFDAGLEQQVRFDLEAFERATGRRLTEGEREKAMAVQRQASRWTFLGSGMTHPEFLRSLGRMGPAVREKVEKVAPAFC
ncbi:MAG TPA: diiron oxygenase [Thermoanaerobaculia bacterium]|nr:diiron oxygenase [Thermoanaerobaculia bacterium]HQN08291.1 diiron oxygenase [Thermoanaerobaculia bacterium]